MRLRSHARNAGRIRTVIVRRAALALAVLLAVGVAVPLATASSADAASSNWKWTSAIRVAHFAPDGSGNVSCPTSKLCLAADANRIIWSTSPKVAKSWTSFELEPLTSPYLDGGDVAIEAVDCPSANFCAAVDNVGQIFTTTTPTAGAAAWTKTTLSNDTYASLTAVSCASATVCAVLAESGAGFTLTPTGWQRAQVIPHERPNSSSVSCASATLCAAVEADGYVYTVNPSVGGEWKRTKLSTVKHSVWTSIDCPSATMCIAVGSANSRGVVAVSKSLTKSTWTSSAFKSSIGGLSIVACKSAKFCLLVGGGKDYWSTKPTSSSSSWHAFKTQTSNSQVEAACLDSKTCLIGDTGGKLRIGHRK